MKKLLLSLLAVLTVSMTGMAKKVDFGFPSFVTNETWSNSYASHTYSDADCTISFDSFSKQAETMAISDCPVTKNGSITVNLKNNATFSAITFGLKQWSTKANTGTLTYSTDGENFSAFSPAVTQSFTAKENGATKTISPTSIPEGTVAIKISFSLAKNQIGVTYVEFSTGAQEPVEAGLAYEEKEYSVPVNGTITPELINPNNLTVTYSSDDLSIATVDGNGTVTPVKEGSTVIRVHSEAVGNYLAGDASYTLVVSKAVTPTCATPVFSVADGSKLYADDTVTITCATEGAVITYQVKGENDYSVIKEGNAPIVITFPADGIYTITSVAFKDGYDDSEEVSAIYEYAAERPQITTSVVTFEFNNAESDNYISKLNSSLTAPTNASSGTELNDKTIVNNGVTFAISKTDGTGARWWMTTTKGLEARAYNGNTLTFSVEKGAKIDEIEFVQGAGTDWSTISADCGTVSDKTWTAGSESVEKVVISCSGKSFFTSVNVKVSKAAGSEVETVEVPQIGRVVYVAADDTEKEGDATSTSHSLDDTKHIRVHLTHSAEGVKLYHKFVPLTKTVSLANDADYEGFDEHDAATGVKIEKAGTLSYYAQNANGTRSEIKSIGFEGETTSISEVAAEAAAEWFDLQGRRVVAPANGVYVKRQGATVSKVRL